MTTTTTAIIRPRGFTAAQWGSQNPVLAVRELVLETDTHQFKVGDGVSHYSTLPYWNAGGGGGGDFTAAIQQALLSTVSPSAVAVAIANALSPYASSAELAAGLSQKLSISEVGQPNGVPNLDANGVIPLEQIPGVAGGLADGDKGDVVISGGVWSLDPAAPAILNKVMHVASRADLAALSGGYLVAYLHEAGRAGTFIFNGSNLSAKVAIDTAQGVYVALSSDTTGASGAWVRVTKANAFELEWFGGGASASGTANSAAMLCAWNLLKDVGGSILFPVGLPNFANTVFPPSTATVAIVAPTVTEMHPSNPVDGTFMWYFDDGGAGGETLVEFYNIHVNGKITSGAVGKVFCGIYVGGTNNLIMVNCKGRYVSGTAWKIVRAYNAYIELKTWRSGKADGSYFAMQLTGRASDGLTFNDVAFGNAGATEQDYYGWLFENGIKLRMPMTKVHGAPDGHSIRGIQIHRVTDYNVALWLTQGYAGNGWVHVSDQDNGGGITQKDACSTATARCSGRLLIQSQTDVQVLNAGGGNFDLVTLDLGTSTSGAIVDGFFRPQATPAGTSDYRQIGLASPGNSSAKIDLTRVFASDDVTTKLVDDRRTATSKKVLIPAASPPRPVETTYKNTTSSTRAVGEVVIGAFAGDGTVPPMNVFGATFDTGSRGTRFASPYAPLAATRYGTFTAATRILPTSKPPVPSDAAAASLVANLKRVQVSAEGIASTYDPANCWVLDIYDLGTLQQSLILSRGTLSSTSGDALPSVVSGSSTQGYLMDFWKGLAALSMTKGHYVAAWIRPIGSPPALIDCRVELSFEISE